MSATIVAGVPAVRQGFAVSAAPDEATVKRLQQAARALGLVLAAWEFDDGRYSKLELCRNSDLATLTVLWEAEV